AADHGVAQFAKMCIGHVVFFEEHRGTGFAGPRALPPEGSWRSDTKCAKPGGRTQKGEFGW
ncbi:hypothetical protein, partial [Mycobacterium tuberculosis]|uniref:hypothetical protein n=1 Tax=Mycobacterium tuberculosis TaxID=1773 RepID=UPI0019D4A106